MLFGWDENSFVKHPLAPDAEADYRYRTGGTTTIRLQDGRVVQLVELEIVPRRADPHLINGSFWLDVQTHSVVQIAFKLARKIDVLRDLEDEDDPEDDDIPGFLRNITAEVDYVTIEYGLYDLRWWMPRIIAFEGGVRVGPFRMPLLYERSYSEYEIQGVDHPVAITMAEMMQRDSVRRVQDGQCDNQMAVRVTVGGDKPASRDTSDAQQTPRCGRWEIAMSADTAKILSSDLLPKNEYSNDEELLTESDLKRLKDHLKGLPGVPALLSAPDVKYSIIDPGMVRYNRIEGLSVGSSVSVDFGNYAVNAQARIGIADLEPNFELGIQRPGQNISLTLAAYRRLNSTDPWRRPFTIGNSLTSLLFGQEDTDFYRSLGIELRGEPAGAGGGSYWWRLYAQQERAADVETQFSVRHLLNDAYEFRPNIVADEIESVGGEVVWRFQHGLNPTGFRFGAELYGNAATGSTNFGRGAVTLRFGIPLPGPLDMATEYAAGSSFDSVPFQHHWYMGGAGTLRGYDGGQMIGESFWRGRAEIGWGMPAVKLVAFTDLGWAGPRDEFSKGRALLSVGAGTSFLDGLLRFDVARAVRKPTGWAAILYFDAAL
jgi:hypothetical protein